MVRQKMPKKIKKRDGSIVPFEKGKITNAVYKAAMDVLSSHQKADVIAASITDIVTNTLSEKFKDRIPDVESIQDIVESSLMVKGYSTIAKSYILHRHKRSEIRFAKTALDLRDDLKLPVNTMEVLKRRYLLKDNNQNIIETPGEMFRRAASHIAQAQANFKSDTSVVQAEEKFYQMMRNLEFMPNSPTLMNSGTSFGQLSACFVLPVEDSIDGIFESLKNMARIHQSGGGTGFNFSHLRPEVRSFPQPREAHRDPYHL